jgi:phosphonopyruvate decarboxylase
MISCKEFYDTLIRKNIDFFTGVPDSILKDFSAYLMDNSPNDKNIITANEGSSIALATGHHLATNKIPLVYMQNSGQGNAINPLTSLTDKEVYGVPLILLIGWRGEPGIKDEPQHLKQGRITLPLLDTLEIPYQILSSKNKNLEKTIEKAIDYTLEKKSPYALVVKKDTFTPYSLKNKSETLFEFNREDAIYLIMDQLGHADIIVSTTGKTSRELYEYRKEKNQGHEKDFLTVGSMGHSSQIALGIALSKPNSQVYCFDGDGAFLMHMGGIPIIGTKAPKNFKHIIFNNGAHDSVGGQPTVGFDINIPKIAEASGYKTVMEAQSKDEIIKKIKILKFSEGPSLLEILVNKGARKNLGRPTRTPLQNKKDFMNFLKDKK